MPYALLQLSEACGDEFKADGVAFLPVAFRDVEDYDTPGAIGFCPFRRLGVLEGALAESSNSPYAVLTQPNALHEPLGPEAAEEYGKRLAPERVAAVKAE